MARQEGIIQLTGSIGNLSFYKSQDGYLARKKSGPGRDRIMSDPAYARTRENIAEFRRAVLATKLLRRAFHECLRSTIDNRASSRLTGAMVKVIQGDARNPRGERKVLDGKVALLEGFEFNRNGKLESTFSAPYIASIDRATGTLTVDVPSCIPARMISSPKGATHFRLKVGGAAIDFEGNTFSVTTLESADVAISEEVQGPLQFRQHVPPGSIHPLFLIFGIEFSQSVNGIQHPLNNGAFNAMAIVKVEGCAADKTDVHTADDQEILLAKNIKRNSSRVVITFPNLQLMGMSSPLIKTHLKTVQNPEKLWLLRMDRPNFKSR